MHSPSLHKQQLLDLAISPLVIQTHGRGHPNIGCRFGNDWLRVSTKFDGVPLIARYPRSSVGANDLATFRAALKALVAGAASSTSHRLEAPLGIVLTTDAELQIMLADGNGDDATAAASIQDARGCFEGLVQIQHVYPM